jgi:hypothetical protein
MICFYTCSVKYHCNVIFLFNICLLLQLLICGLAFIVAYTNFGLQSLVRKPEGKKPFGRSRHRWKDKIKMDLQDVGCEGMDWIDVTQDRERWQALVNVAMNLRVP